MMDADVKAKWVAELRSGRHVQGRNVLRNSLGEKCCLGVLAEDVMKVPSCRRGHQTYYDFIIHEGSAPLPSCTSVPSMFCGLLSDEITTLVTMNDSSGATFAQIADFIEANL